jgi:hypothetical protein
MLVWEKLYSLSQPCHDPRHVTLLSLIVAIGAVCDRETEGLPHQIKQLVEALQGQLGAMFDQLYSRSSLEMVQIMLLQVCQALHESANREHNAHLVGHIFVTPRSDKRSLAIVWRCRTHIASIRPSQKAAGRARFHRERSAATLSSLVDCIQPRYVSNPSTVFVQLAIDST